MKKAHQYRRNQQNHNHATEMDICGRVVHMGHSCRYMADMVCGQGYQIRVFFDEGF